MKSIIGIFPTATHTNSISYGRIGAYNLNSYIRDMDRKIVQLIVIAIILATIGYFVGKTAKETYKQKDIQEEVSDSLNYGRKRW